MGVEDDDLDELERRMREKLFADVKQNGHPALGRLSDDEMQIAKRIVGTANADRIVSAREGRRVRPLPVRVFYEWYWVRTDSHMYGETWWWRINRVENGKSFHHSEGGFDRELKAQITALRAKGFTVVDANKSLEPSEPKAPKVSARKAALDDLRTFRR